MQLHAWEGFGPSTTFDMLEMQDDQFDGWLWILLLAQLVDAMVFLNKEVHILHNADNILITQSIPSCCHGVEIALIDFGKANHIFEAKKYHLSDFEKQEHFLILLLS